MKRIGILLSLAVLAVAPQGAHAREIGETSIFTRIGDPGAPEGLAVRDGIVYVGTHVPARGNSGQGPSKIFTYDLATRAPLRTYTIEGQNVAATHGILSMAFDGAGRLYVLDRNPPRLLRIDPATGAQETYATIPDLAACRPIGPTTDCAPVTVDEPAFPDYFAFDAAGNAYITDLQAATIFRVRPHEGTARAEIWFQDARLDGIFGPNGIAIEPGGSSLLFAMTGSQQPATLTRGLLYRLPLTDAPTAADLTLVHEFPEPAAGPDGFAFGASGRIYVALAGANQVSVIEPGRGEVARFPDVVANAQQEIPYDLPASIAFNELTRSILVTNQSFFAGNASNWSVLEAFVDDTALPLIEPLTIP